jgi:hypothetical protein
MIGKIQLHGRLCSSCKNETLLPSSGPGSVSLPPSLVTANGSPNEAERPQIRMSFLKIHRCVSVLLW